MAREGQWKLEINFNNGLIYQSDCGELNVGDQFGEEWINDG